MTDDKKRSFLQETAFEEDVNLEEKPDSKDLSKSADYIRRYWAKKLKTDSKYHRKEVFLCLKLL